ncbi:hypothetical protein SDC9_181388 [bioreactor metagenome]|uniref:Uncharacterized protein n=1 Tax=bioreactor metagenome TaxID=1076179 RepID=A0A645H5Y4_9ZZZZ
MRHGARHIVGRHEHRAKEDAPCQNGLYGVSAKEEDAQHKRTDHRKRNMPGDRLSNQQVQKPQKDGDFADFADAAGNPADE